MLRTARRAMQLCTKTKGGARYEQHKNGVVQQNAFSSKHAMYKIQSFGSIFGPRNLLILEWLNFYESGRLYGGVQPGVCNGKGFRNV